MAGEWREVSLSEVAEITSGKRPLVVSKEASFGCSVPVIGGGGPSGFTSHPLFDGGVLITGRVGTLGKLFAPDGPCWPSDNALVVRPRSDDTDSTYLRYAMQLVIAEAAGMNRGAANPLITQGDLGRLVVRHPPLPEQRAIAAILGALDDKIELNWRTNVTLEEMAQTLFKSWFVDFAHFRGGGMEDSPLGQVPRGWGTGKLADIATFVKGVSYSSDELKESLTALVTLKSVARGGGYLPDGLKSYVGEYKPEQQVIPGEVVVAHTDLTQAAEVLGRAARVQADRHFQKLIASLDLTVVRPAVRHVSNEFIYGLLSRSQFTEHAYGYANGTTVLHLSSRALPEYQCVLPPEDIVAAFTNLVCPFFWRADNNEEESRTAAALRDELLPRLMSGEIRVKDSEKSVREAE